MLEIKESKKELIKYILFFEFGNGVPSKQINGNWIHRKDREEELDNLSIEKLENIMLDLKNKTSHLINKSDVSINWNFNFKVHNIEDNAREILNNNPLYFDPFLNEWYIWDKNEFIWRRTKETIIFDNIKRVFSTSGLSISTNRTALLNALKDESQSRKPKAPPETWVQIGDKIYDIASNNDFIPVPDYFIKTKIPFNVGKSTKVDFIDKLFTDWQGENKQVLYDIAALTISPKNFIDIFFFFQGGGSDGKSVYIKILQTLVGIENTKSVNLELISDPKERFETSFLIDKYLCLLGDGNFPILKHTKFLKEACGSSDLISAQKKGSSETIDFESKATIIGSFNTLPQTNDLTDGFFRRMHLTFWNNKFDGKEDVFTKLVVNHQEEFSNLLNVLIKRLREIYQSREINGKLSIEETRTLYLKNSDVIRQFLENEAIVDINGAFTAAKAYEEFKLWADKNRYNAFDYKTFKNNLGEQTVVSYQKTWVYSINNGHIYRKEEDIPFEFTGENIDRSQIFVYRGMTLKSSIKKTILNNKRDEEFVIDDRLSVKLSMGDVAEFKSGEFKEVN